MNRLTVIAICSMALCIAVSADVIHVPEEYETIQEAIDAAGLGDIIAVAFGTYEENIELKPGITVLGSNPKPTIDGSGDMYGSTVEYSGYGPSPHQTTLQNFIITGAFAQVRLDGVGNVEILGNTLIQNVSYYTGVEIAYPEPDIVISGNAFEGGWRGVARGHGYGVSSTRRSIHYPRRSRGQELFVENGPIPVE